VVEYNRPQQIWPILAVLPIAQILIITGLFMAVADRQAQRPPVGVIVLILLFVLVAAMSTALAFRPEAAIEAWRYWVSWILVIVLLSSVVSTRERLLLFVFVYYLVNLKMAQHGFKTWAGRGFSMEGWGVTGSPGWFQNSGEFGMQMAMLVPLLSAHVLLAKDRFNRRVLLLTLLFLVMVVGSVIASNSRGALLGLAVTAVWFIGFSRGRLKALVATSVAIVAVVVAIPTETVQRFHTVGEDSTSQSRLTYWRYGMQAVQEYPAFGIGFRNWVPYMTERHPEAFDITGRVEVIHNTYIEAATELGFIGFSVIVAILFYIFWTNLRTTRRARATGDAWLAATAAGMNGSLVVYLVSSTFMSVLTYPYIWMMLSMAAAGALAVRNPSAVTVGGGVRVKKGGPMAARSGRRFP
jgi:O-antigen ligase